MELHDRVLATDVAIGLGGLVAVGAALYGTTVGQGQVVVGALALVVMAAGAYAVEREPLASYVADLRVQFVGAMLAGAGTVGATTVVLLVPGTGRIVAAGVAGMAVGFLAYRVWFGILRPIPDARLALERDRCDQSPDGSMTDRSA